MLLLATTVYAEGAPRTRCMKSGTQNISRIIPQDVESAKALGWQGPTGVNGFRAKIAPDIGDNGNRIPGHFRLAYFYAQSTSALYTSSVDPSQAAIEYQGPAQSCGASK